MEKQKRPESKRARPDPVSCHSCRAKKLRCNRRHPCSNCLARSIECVFLVPPKGQQPEGPQVGATSSTTLIHNEDLVRRLERLESLVLGKNAAGEESGSGKEKRVVNVGSERDGDILLLENVGIREDSLLRSLSGEGLVGQTGSVQDILALQSSPGATNALLFPTYMVAVLLLDNYELNVDHMCRILHNPSVRTLMKTVYVQLGRKQPVLPSQAALFLALFSLSAFFYPPCDGSPVASTEQESVRLATFWSQAAWDGLSRSQWNTSGTLEDIQACILMSYTTFHLDGFSARGRLLSTMAASIARDLCLHRLDAADSSLPLGRQKKAASIRSLLDDEVKRRVFWHIASTEWLHSTISGPQEGTYFLHPRHIRVRLPQNCNDEDLALVETDADSNTDSGQDQNSMLLGSQPTSMAFFLERVRLAHLCREMTDTVPLDSREMLQLPYEHVVALDQKLQDYLASLPVFFRLDPESLQACRPLETVYPRLSVARYCINAAAHTRRCRLHQRFLLRLASDPRYAYSREACLASARAIILAHDEELGTSREDRGTIPPPLLAGIDTRMAMVVHFTHLALAVLVLDLCFNKGEQGEERRKADVAAAFRKLRGDRRRNAAAPLLGRSLDSLAAVLQKYHVCLPPEDPDEQGPGFGDQTHDASGEDVLVPAAVSVQDSRGIATDASFFDQFLQTTMPGEDLDLNIWDTLFSALDTRPI